MQVLSGASRVSTWYLEAPKKIGFFFKLLLMIFQRAEFPPEFCQHTYSGGPEGWQHPPSMGSCIAKWQQ